MTFQTEHEKRQFIKAREQRAASVAMLYAALEGLNSRDIALTVSAALRDCGKVTPADLEHLSNVIGREAHQRARDSA